MGELREELPWVRTDSTALVRGTDGEVRWWTFAGGVANTILAQQLKRWGEAKADNVSITIEGEPPIDEMSADLAALAPQEISPQPDPCAIENLKFSEALPRSLADRVFCARFDDDEGIQNVLAEPIRNVSEGEDVTR
jgi:ATP-dependent Lhr-like helicase